MHSFISRISVDGALTSVSQYEFASSANFVLSPTASKNDWAQFFGQKVDSIWLYATPSPDIEHSVPNGWKIALELKSTKMVTLELYNTEEPNGAIFLVRSFSDKHDAAPLSDWKALITDSICHAGRRVNDGTTLQDIILKVQAAGLLQYKLKLGRGQRYWMTAVLSTIGGFIFEPVTSIPLVREADELMRRCWIRLAHHTKRYGFRDEVDNRLNIAKGNWEQAPAGQNI